MKTCRKCKRSKLLGEFGFKKQSKDGHQECCLECNRSMGRAYYQNNRERNLSRKKQNQDRYRARLRQLIEEAKAGKRCLYCEEDDTCCMDFHHLGDKRYSVADMPTTCVSEATLKAEIEKCEIICSNCHRKLHAGRKLIRDGPDGKALASEARESGFDSRIPD